MPLRTRTLAAALALLLGSALPAGASGEITVIYDAEFAGYLPVVGGIARPDLVADRKEGRVPVEPRWVKWKARGGVRRNRFPEVPPLEEAAFAAVAETRKPSRRWLRRTAIRSEFLVLDPYGRPVEGARVYRYTDPSFYPVNQDRAGARLFGTWRFLPHPFHGDDAAAFAQLLDPLWRAEDFVFVRAGTPVIDATHNPWTRPYPAPVPPLEYVGETGPDGGLHVATGVFNLRDTRRFPQAVVPDALRVGFVVVADGYLPTTTEKRFRRGGAADVRTLQLLTAPEHPLLTSDAFRAGLRLVDALALDGRTPDDLAAELDRLAETLVPALSMVPAERRETARAEALARWWERLARRAPAAWHEPLARRALALTPDRPDRAVRLAALLAAGAGVHFTDPPPHRTPEPLPALDEAERLLAAALEREPRVLPAYRWLDTLLTRRGAPDGERRRWIERLLAAQPFDGWGRARMAAFLLRGGRVAESFDNLRYTAMAFPGLGGDRELARALSAHYWQIGLPEKAGAYAWLLTGRVPEDPMVPPAKR